MSEYQCYDFYSIDRPLTPEERSEISTFSSRVNPSSRRATFIYNYSDFRYNEEEVLNDYFDMMLYISNWGTRRLMLKIPVALVSEEKLKAYKYEGSSYIEQYVKIYRKGKNLLIDLFFGEEDGGGWVEGEGLLDEILPLRSQIIEGDYRLLYLAWLHLVSQNPEEDGELLEPPLPANLKTLDYALESFIDFWGIDGDIIAAASEKSEVEESTPDRELADQIVRLTDDEKTHYLELLLSEEGQAKHKLQQRLTAFISHKPVKQQRRRTLSELQEATAKQSHLRREKEKREAEQAHIQKMEKIGKRQASMWEEVRSNSELKSGRGYDNATELLHDLKAYAVYSGQVNSFENKLADILERYGKSVAYRRRLQTKGII